MSPIIPSAIVAFCICALTVWMNIQIRHSSKDEVTQLYFKILRTVLLAAIAGFSCYTLYIETTSREPLNRKSILEMVLAGCGLLFVVGCQMLVSMVKVINRLHEQSLNHLLISEKLTKRLLSLETPRFGHTKTAEESPLKGR